jgi:membrane-associated phospholipid phosphatase
VKAVRPILGILSLLSLVCLPAAAGAQETAKADTTIPDRKLFHRNDLYVLGAFTLGTIALFPLDEHLAKEIRKDNLVSNKTLRNLSTNVRFFGGQGPYIIGGSLYLGGRLFRVRRAAELGLHGTEAVVVGLGTAGVLKLILGRARPYVVADSLPGRFKIMRGLKSEDYKSFPSGHSTAAFSAAAAVTAEAADWWPQHRWLVATVMYGGATLVGISRMYDDKHWASDVLMGAAIGTFAGQKTVRFNHTHTGNRLDRWLLGTAKEGASHMRVTTDGTRTYLGWTIEGVR